MKRRILWLLCCAIVLWVGCKKANPVEPGTIPTPHTYLWLYPDSTISPGISQQHLHWWGSDPAGTLVGYLFAVGKNLKTPGSNRFTDTVAWHWRIENDTLISFPLTAHHDTFQIAVRAVDNVFAVKLPDTAIIHLSPFAYWDKNHNGIFDSTDVALPTLLSATDPVGALFSFPLISQPPVVVFATDPNSGATIQEPDTTYTAATFAWVGTDADGDFTVNSFRINLNNPLDSTKWVTLPGNNSVISQSNGTSMITLYVPRTRSDTAGSVVTADIYSGNFLSRHYIGSIQGLRLDGLNTLYLQAQNLAGDRSARVQLPAAGASWFVKRPRGKLLMISDYISSDSTAARAVYAKAFSDPSINLSFDELNIGRGVSPNAKQNASQGLANPQFGSLVTPFIDPAFIYTLFLYDYVFWYTDLFPTLPVAQLSLFPYYSSSFDGRRGKVIFSTAFEFNPDPLGLMKDFAPIDSISSINLSNRRLLPTLGDDRIPGGYQIVPDSSNGADIFPPMGMSTFKANFSIYLRPIYRRADARYIYHVQDDTRNPLRYVNLVTPADLLSTCSVQSSVWSCGIGGTIVYSSDGGQTWTRQASSVQTNLRQIQFIDANHGFCVGDNGSVLKTTNAGTTWQNISVLTFEDLLGLSFTSSSNGIVVGTNGLLIRTTNGGSTWTSIHAQVGATLRSVNFIDANHGLATGDSGVVINTVNGGVSWTRKNLGFIQSINSIAYASGSVAYAVAATGNIFQSTDGGFTWTFQQQLPLNPVHSMYFLDSLHGWISGTIHNGSLQNGGAVLYTTDGGASWSTGPAPGIPNNYPNNIPPYFQDLEGVVFSSLQNGVCVGSGGIILRTTDGGTTWAFEPHGNLNIAVIDGNNSFVFIAVPLHLLNGDPAQPPLAPTGTFVRDFFRYIFNTEFTK